MVAAPLATPDIRAAGLSVVMWIQECGLIVREISPICALVGLRILGELIEFRGRLMDGLFGMDEGRLNLFHRYDDRELHVQCGGQL